MSRRIEGLAAAGFAAAGFRASERVWPPQASLRQASRQSRAFRRSRLRLLSAFLVLGNFGRRLGTQQAGQAQASLPLSLARPTASPQYSSSPTWDLQEVCPPPSWSAAGPYSFHFFSGGESWTGHLSRLEPALDSLFGGSTAWKVSITPGLVVCCTATARSLRSRSCAAAPAGGLLYGLSGGARSGTSSFSAHRERAAAIEAVQQNNLIPGSAGLVHNGLERVT